MENLGGLSPPKPLMSAAYGFHSSIVNAQYLVC